MSTLEEIENALGVIAYGMMKGESPSKLAFKDAYHSEEGKNILKERVVLLHCTSEYPAPPEEINLNAMQTMRNQFNLDVGYSDHSNGITIPIAATALGASVIEKHFTLDKNLPGPDHKASLEPAELKLMIESIRTVEKAFGDGQKIPSISEIKNRDIARKSIVAAEDIQEGEKFTEINLTVKRPGTGKSPMEYWDLLGQESHRTYQAEDLVI
jgi:N-acetylneuraminate synthase